MGEGSIFAWASHQSWAGCVSRSVPARVSGGVGMSSSELCYALSWPARHDTYPSHFTFKVTFQIAHWSLIKSDSHSKTEAWKLLCACDTPNTVALEFFSLFLRFVCVLWAMYARLCCTMLRSHAVLQGLLAAGSFCRKVLGVRLSSQHTGYGNHNSIAESYVVPTLMI